MHLLIHNFHVFPHRLTKICLVRANAELAANSARGHVVHELHDAGTNPLHVQNRLHQTGAGPRHVDRLSLAVEK